MTLGDLVNFAINKQQFLTLQNYIDFCARYLNFVQTGLQAQIVSQNENHYCFYQYRQEANFNITRPINTRLMYNVCTFAAGARQFLETLADLRDRQRPADTAREAVIRTIYTIQQTIGAALDALPSGQSNTARKINGDLFERLIRLIITYIDVNCLAGTMKIPVDDNDGNRLCTMDYQHDLLISREGELKIIGSVKTSSKDRIDKVFVDKYLYSILTGTALPHIAIFLNDVQRKKNRGQNRYGINATFLPGHFKGYTIKLNPLDGVYYCDIRPNMITDNMLSQYIKTIDHFFYSDLWHFLEEPGQAIGEIAISERDEGN
ncbi:MAG: hypothetical protein WAK96_14960 [Desulfobaccales bacterium]